MLVARVFAVRQALNYHSTLRAVVYALLDGWLSHEYGPEQKNNYPPREWIDSSQRQERNELERPKAQAIWATLTRVVFVGIRFRGT